MLGDGENVQHGRKEAKVRERPVVVSFSSVRGERDTLCRFVTKAVE